MIVKEIMKTDVATCTTRDDVAKAIGIMRDHNCGFLPLIDAQGTVAGVVTDRDLCFAATGKARPADHVPLKEVMSHPVFSCFGDENLKGVLIRMAKHHVRHLPVLTREGHLEGVLSIDDVARAPHKRGGPTAEDIVEALKGMNAPKLVEV